MLGSVLTGNYLAGAAPTRVYVGHWVATLNYAQKARDVNWFYDGPLDDERRAFVRTVMERLTAQTDVVVLAAPVDLDDHEDFALSGPAGRVHHLPAAMTPRNNLAVQTAVLRRASALVSNFGGFAHLAALLGTRTFAFSAQPHCLPHADIMLRAVRELRRHGLDTGFSLLSTNDLGLIGLIGDPAAAAAQL